MVRNVTWQNFALTTLAPSPSIRIEHTAPLTVHVPGSHQSIPQPPGVAEPQTQHGPLPGGAQPGGIHSRCCAGHRRSGSYVDHHCHTAAVAGGHADAVWHRKTP